jgi:Leucine-rich repeat (LRR) protein
VLNLDGNRLITLPQEIARLTSLQELYDESCCPHIASWLHQNRLEAVPSGFGRMTRLRILTLSENLLSQVPDDFATLTSLNESSARFVF